MSVDKKIVYKIDSRSRFHQTKSIMMKYFGRKFQRFYFLKHFKKISKISFLNPKCLFLFILFFSLKGQSIQASYRPFADGDPVPRAEGHGGFHVHGSGNSSSVSHLVLFCLQLARAWKFISLFLLVGINLFLMYW